MADPTADDGLSALIQAFGTGASTANGIGTNNAANAQTQAAYAAILKNLKDRFGDYQNLGPAGYKDITAQQLGPSALGSIPTDAASRADQQAALAQDQDIANRGGLSLSDQAALNQIQSNLNRNAGARNQSTLNSFAARGELGGGAALGAQLQNNQAATQSANEAGEATAGQAQQRAMQAILQKAQASRTMSQDDYAKKAAAAQATDAISKYNAGALTDAGKYNNTLAGQSYADQLAKLQGEGNVTGQLNTALLGSGQQNANTTLANGQVVQNGIGSGGGILSKLVPKSGGGGGSTDPGSDPGIVADTNGTRGGPSDLTGGATDTNDPTTGGATTAGVSLADDGFEDYPGGG